MRVPVFEGFEGFLLYQLQGLDAEKNLKNPINATILG